MKKVKIIVLLTFISISVILINRSCNSDQIFFNSKIEGIIEEIKISTKGYHSALLTNGKSIYLGYYRSCIKDIIRQGDFLIKEKNSWEIKILRNNGRSYEIIITCTK
jgi:hypothetical protein